MQCRRLGIDESQILAALWDQAQNGIAIVDADGRWIDANRALCALLEYSDAELRRLTWMDITHPGDVDADAEMAAELRRHAIGGYDMVKRYLTKSGRVVWASLRVVPIVGEDRQFVAYLSQVSPVVPVSAPAEERRVRTTWRWVRDYWPQIVTVLGACGVVLGGAVQYLTRK